MRGRNLPIVGLQHVRIHSLQDSGTRAGETGCRREPRRMFANSFAAPACFNAHHFYVRVTEKIVKQPDCVRASADTRKKKIWDASLGFENLRVRLLANNPMKIAHHHWVGVRAENRAE